MPVNFGKSRRMRASVSAASPRRFSSSYGVYLNTVSSVPRGTGLPASMNVSARTTAVNGR
jgi:hypothetical protein